MENSGGQNLKSIEVTLPKPLSEPEQKYLDKLKQMYEAVIDTFPKEEKKNNNRTKKEHAITAAFDDISALLSHQKGHTFGDLPKAILKFKIARYFEQAEKIDSNLVAEAIIGNPEYLDTNGYSLRKFLEVSQTKALQKIAEIRKRRAENKDDRTFNPYEALFETSSGKYYVARLLNMEHLEEESKYLGHCIGEEGSYINKIKHKEIEVFSFRQVSKFNKSIQKLEGDTPLVTIVYNPRTKIIEQIRADDDFHISDRDAYFTDIIEALKQLRTTKTDTGKLRDFSQIAPGELGGITPEDYLRITGSL